jgi:hypothetical protein
MLIPSAAEPLFLSLSVAFTEPTSQRFLTLLVAAVLTTGRRTVSNLFRTGRTLMNGDLSTYHRVFSKRRWTTLALSKSLAAYILTRFVPAGPVFLAGDDTVEEHRGKKVYGKGCHRDAVRSTHSFTAYRWGHKWVVLAILVTFPWSPRPWALPILVALYHPKDWNLKHGRRHKTPVVLMRQMLALLIHWFPHRTFIFSGDGGYGTHDLARFAHKHSRRLTLVSRFYPHANLYAPPPRRQRKKGRPRLKGAKLPAPARVVARAPRTRLSVSWYGGGTRRVQVVTGVGHWYKLGAGLVPVRWVFVHDLTGTHRDEYFFTTATDMAPRDLIQTFTGRWSIEVTFAELRAYLGLETTRGWCAPTILRMAPCLFGLYSVVALLYAECPLRHRSASITWRGKQTTTFSDAITAVRRWMWADWVFETSRHSDAFSKLPRALRATLLYALAPAA